LIASQLVAIAWAWAALPVTARNAAEKPMSSVINTRTPAERERTDAENQVQLEVLAEELRRHRKLRGLSLEALAAQSSVSKSMISKIERAEATPSTAVLARLAEALGVTFSRLMAPVDVREILVIPAARQPVLPSQPQDAAWLLRFSTTAAPARQRFR